MRSEGSRFTLAGQHLRRKTGVPTAGIALPLAIAAQVDDGRDAERGDGLEILVACRDMLARAPQRTSPDPSATAVRQL